MYFKNIEEMYMKCRKQLKRAVIYVKKECILCKSCMEDLKGIFTKEQLQWFEAVFYSNTAGRIFKRKEVQSDEYMILEGTVCFRRIYNSIPQNQ